MRLLEENPVVRKFLMISLLVFAGMAFLGFVSIGLQLALPAPTGPYAVGRTAAAWVDETRPEVLTDAPQDKRSIVVDIWYPAQTGTGQIAPYFPGLEQVSAALRASGEVSLLEVAGMSLVRSNSFLEVQAAIDGAPFPVLLLSPGNGTNVEFYGGLAEELASRGYVVIGLNHPYDVAGVALADNRVAGYYSQQWDLSPEDHQKFSQERIEVRVQDALFALDHLEELNAGDSGLLAGRLDLTRVGFLGHSLGGITAAQSCVRDVRFKVCLNLDGIQAGGPFSAHADPVLPEQPFMMITKEEQLPLRMTEQFETLRGGGTLVVVHGARHDSFTDGPLLIPSILPIENQADRVLEIIRKYMLAFFDQELKGQPSALLANPHSDDQVSVERYIQAYPHPLPAGGMGSGRAFSQPFSRSHCSRVRSSG